jgi:hypothetical protein
MKLLFPFILYKELVDHPLYVLVYVFCRVYPNAPQKPHDKTCDAVPLITPTLALLICNPHIQAASVIISNPTCQTHEYEVDY